MIITMIRGMIFSALVFMSVPAIANVTVIINKQVYDYEQPVRLNEILKPVANLGEWYWPVSSVYDLNRSYAEREKESVLSEIRRLLNVYNNNSDMYRTLTNLYEQVASWTLATRIPMEVSYNRARISPPNNPKFQDGKYLIRLSPRPDVIHFLGAVTKPGAYKHSGNTSIFTVANSVTANEEADNSYVRVITPMGEVEKKGVAYWNIDFAQVMPGTQIYVPISAGVFDTALERLNDRIANLAVHRILPQ